MFSITTLDVQLWMFRLNRNVASITLSLIIKYYTNNILGHSRYIMK